MAEISPFITQFMGVWFQIAMSYTIFGPLLDCSEEIYSMENKKIHLIRQGKEVT